MELTRVDLSFDEFPETDGWHLNPYSDDEWEMEGLIADGQLVGTVETFWYERFYPHAYDPSAREWRRGGCYESLASAKAWAEKICGVRPRTSGMSEGSPSSPFVEE